MDYEILASFKRVYPLEFKHRVCKEHIVDGLKLRELVQKYALSTHSLIHDWLRQLGYLPATHRQYSRVLYLGPENHPELGKKSIQGTTVKPGICSPEQAEIDRLKRELEDAKILAEGYKRMVEIAEQELKIPIRKKYNTK